MLFFILFSLCLSQFENQGGLFIVCVQWSGDCRRHLSESIPRVIDQLKYLKNIDTMVHGYEFDTNNQKNPIFNEESTNESIFIKYIDHDDPKSFGPFSEYLTKMMRIDEFPKIFFKVPFKNNEYFILENLKIEDTMDILSFIQDFLLNSSLKIGVEFPSISSSFLDFKKHCLSRKKSLNEIAINISNSSFLYDECVKNGLNNLHVEVSRLKQNLLSTGDKDNRYIRLGQSSLSYLSEWLPNDLNKTNRNMIDGEMNRLSNSIENMMNTRFGKLTESHFSKYRWMNGRLNMLKNIHELFKENDDSIDREREIKDDKDNEEHVGKNDKQEHKEEYNKDNQEKYDKTHEEKYNTDHEEKHKEEYNELEDYTSFIDEDEIVLSDEL